MAEGIPVRKSGIRIGEVTAIAFDDRPNQPDGVLVTLSLERKYKIKAGSVPRLIAVADRRRHDRHAPRHGPGLISTSANPAHAPIIEGAVAPDPSKALAAATEAFEKVGRHPQPRSTRPPTGLAAADQERRERRRVPDHLERDRQERLDRGRRGSTGSSRPTRPTSSRRSPTSARSRRSSTPRSTREPRNRCSPGSNQFSSASARLDTSLAARLAFLQGPRRPGHVHAHDRLRPDRPPAESDLP